MDIRKTTLKEVITVRGVCTEVEKATAPADIGSLWGQAGRAGVLSSSAPSFSVYSHYQDRLANAYRVTVGRRDGTGDAEVTLPAGQYAVFEDRGPAPEVAGRLWRYVWTQWSERDRRTFAVDFERHEGALDDATVTLYVGITPDR